VKDDSTVTIGAGAAAPPATASAAPRGVLEPGQQVGHYVVGELLGGPALETPPILAASVQKYRIFAVEKP